MALDYFWKGRGVRVRRSDFHVIAITDDYNRIVVREHVYRNFLAAVAAGEFPHSVSARCATTHCHIHNVDEDDTDAYRVCIECGHVYKTPEHLLAAYREKAPDGAPDRKPDEIFFCQECLHDF